MSLIYLLYSLLNENLSPLSLLIFSCKVRDVLSLAMTVATSVIL